MAVVFATLLLQVALPGDLALTPWWLLPAVSGLLVIALLLINPGWVDHRSRVERMISLMLVAVVSLAKGASAVQVVLGITSGTVGANAVPVLISGCIVYWRTSSSFRSGTGNSSVAGRASRRLGSTSTRT